MIHKRIWLAAAGAIAVAAGSGLSAKEFTGWGAPVKADLLPGSHADVNTPSVDGCPIVSPYDGSLYMASNRPGGAGELDIWIAPKSGDGWGAPVNAGPTINTAAQEFCPSPARGNRFYFVRRISSTDTDIYVVKKLPKGWGTPERLPKGPGLVNSTAEEWSPSAFEAPDGREFLYFSSTRSGGIHRIFYTVDLGVAQMATGDANSIDAAAHDARPNVRHDGLEMVWDSTRGATSSPPDVWSSMRSSVDSPWGTAQRLTAGVGQINSAQGESRPSLSWDGTMLLFGSTRPGEGATDIYVSRRDKITGN